MKPKTFFIAAISIVVFVAVVIAGVYIYRNKTIVGAVLLDNPQMQFDIAEQHYWSALCSVMYSGENNEEALAKSKELREAVSWYKHAAGSYLIPQKDDYPPAQCALGYCWESGYGVWKDPHEGGKWLNASRNGLINMAENGDMRAQYALGNYYLGFGTQERFDYKNMKKLLTDSAEAGYAPAQLMLCCFYAFTLFPDEDEIKLGRKWLRKAAEQEYAPAQFILGICYSKGSAGIEKDENEAMVYFEKAAKQDFAPAMLALGDCYKKGLGTEQDDWTAVEWYRKAANKECAMAEYMLGISYAEGRGVVRDEGNAVEWFLKAADQGVEKAQKELRKRDLY